MALVEKVEEHIDCRADQFLGHIKKTNTGHVLVGYDLCDPNQRLSYFEPVDFPETSGEYVSTDDLEKLEGRTIFLSCTTPDHYKQKVVYTPNENVLVTTFEQLVDISTGKIIKKMVQKTTNLISTNSY
ncbi:MAG: hypothetical protein AAB656_01085 [Patescibacteria group bacterium]